MSLPIANRMAAREMGKALGFDPETLAKISAAVATWEFRDENDALDRAFARCWTRSQTSAPTQNITNCAPPCRIMPRHLGQHSGGMVICQGQLDSVVPLETRFSMARPRGGCSGTRKIAPTWGIIKVLICSALE